MSDTPPRPWTWYLVPRPLFSGDNQVELLRGATELLPALCEAIQGARHEVWLASYILHNDPSVVRVVDALEEAARRGVRVRIVVDGFGTKQSLAALEPRLSAAGVAVGIFRPLDRWTHWFQPGQLRRMHMKVAVVDGERGFIGGINLIDDHHDLSHGLSETPRLDFAVAVRGPVVASMEQAVRAMWLRAWFGQDWREELRELMRGANRLQQIQALIGQMRLTGWRRPSDEHSLRPVRAALVVRDNLRQRRTIERTYVEVLRSARQRIWLVSPYFFPGREFRKVICDAARRGVDVRLLLQGKIDYPLAGLAAKVLYDELLHAGIHIFEYTPAFLHAKVALVDEDWATVGSSNIDPLSLLLNLEANLIVSDAVFNARLATELRLAMTAAHRVDPAKQLTHRWLRRLRSGLGRAIVTWAASVYLRIARAQPRR